MTRSRRSLSDRFARWLLATRFSGDEVEEALSDLHELGRVRAAQRGRAFATLYFWLELARYPFIAAIDDVSGQRGVRVAWPRRSTMQGLREDGMYAIRSLTRRPWFGILTVGILTVAIGANAAIFSVVKSVLVDGLPVHDPDRLLTLWTQDVETGRMGRMTPGYYTDVSALTDVFRSLAAFSSVSATLRGEREPHVLRGGRITSDYFATLGVQPVLGRTFYPNEDGQGEAPVVVLSYRVWRQTFGADSAIVGRAVDLDGTLFEVVGVLPPGLYPASATIDAGVAFTEDNQDFFVPLRYSPDFWRNRAPHIVGTIGRLRDGVTPEQATAALETLMATVEREGPRLVRERLVIRPFREDVVGDVRFGLLMLMGTVGLVLVIAAVNVGALFVLRTADRRAELQVRVALGAPRRRLVQQLLIESALVTSVGAAAGLAAAGVGVGVMRRMVPFQIPRMADARVELSVLAVTLGVAAILAVAFGLAMAVSATRTDVPRGLRGGRRASGDRGRIRLQAWVVAVQAGLAVVVLTGAALFTRSFMALRAVDPGFAAADTWMIPVITAPNVLGDVVVRVRGVPGVAAAGIAANHPLERNWEDGFVIEGVPLADRDDLPVAAVRVIGEGFFEAVGIRAVDGRMPAAIDFESGRGIAVVNRALADRYLADGRVLGRRIQVPSGRRIFGDVVPEWFDIIGVVDNVRFLGPDGGEEPALYLPAAQFPAATGRLLVRPVDGDIDILSSVRAAIRDVAPTVSLDGAQRMGDILADMLARPRFSMSILAAFAVTGILLCALGIYGLVSRVVATRFQEYGIRVALGARPAHLVRSIVGGTLGPTGIGIVAGLAAALVLARLARSALFGVSSHDPLTFVAVPLFAALMALAASLAPARRALRIDPAVTLREE